MAGRRLSVAIVQGGPSTEAEVSRASAAGVAGALVAAGHVPVRLELDAFTAESLRADGYDVVFPLAHGAVGEDGSLQGLLEVLDLPYVGSGVLASALAMHKRMARLVFAAAGLLVAPAVVAARGEPSRAVAERALRELGPAVVVKPSSQGSAIGVSRLEAGSTIDEIVRAIDDVWAIDEFVLVERLARGREITCGVLDLDSAVALDPTEILAPRDPFYTYEARYEPGRSVHQCPAGLPAPVLARVQKMALEAHAALGCRDLSRVDFVVGGDDAGEGQERVTLLEVNTLPGMTRTSLYPEAAAVAGLKMPDLCDRLVTRAWLRGPSARHRARAMPH
jgi:D-alanine-D-alanine ligase